MKKTRNLFVFKGELNDVKKVLSELHFKGLTVLDSDNITLEDIENVFKCNKSLACRYIPNSYSYEQIPIKVINTPSSVSGCINLFEANIASQFESIIQSYNLDIGDAKSNDSGINGAPSIDDCPYCKFLGGHKEAFNRMIYESKNFYAQPTVGQFIRPYLLIIPKVHAFSLGNLAPELLNEFLDVLDDCIYILNLTYHTSNFIVFENGTGNSGKGKAKNSVVHSHIHLVQSNMTAQTIENISKFEFEKIPIEEISKFGNSSYLLIRDEPYWYINEDPKLYIPRQYIRQLLAEEHGKKDEWNWRTHPFYDLIQYTVNDITSALKEHYDMLPERIKQNTQITL